MEQLRLSGFSNLLFVAFSECTNFTNRTYFKKDMYFETLEHSIKAPSKFRIHSVKTTNLSKKCKKKIFACCFIRTDGHIYMTFMFDYGVWRLGNCLFFHFWSSPSQLCSREKIQQKLCSESTCWVAVISSLGQALWKSIFLSAGYISTFGKTKTRHVRAFICANQDSF